MRMIKMAEKKVTPKKKAAPKKCTTTKVVKGMDFSKAALAVVKGSAVKRHGWADTSLVITLSEDGKSFLAPCGKGFCKWSATLEDAMALDWLLV